MLTVILMVFLVTGDGKAQVVHTQKVPSINECVEMASKINGSKQTPYSAACVPLGPSI